MEDWYSIDSYEDMISNQLLLICNKIKEVDNKVDTMYKILRKLEEKINERDERELNKAIRKYAMKNNPEPPIHFVPTKTPISKLL